MLRNAVKHLAVIVMSLGILSTIGYGIYAIYLMNQFLGVSVGMAVFGFSFLVILQKPDAKKKPTKGA
jgi:E3 ubiquitin-protein ligase DOA10